MGLRKLAEPHEKIGLKQLVPLIGFVIMLFSYK
jgi:hypothetical protein